jgi:ribosomal protein S18 acetylase RimI-like enzyme
MAARSDASLLEVVDLTQVGPVDLDPLLAEEIDVWERRFAWDFRPSADMLRRFLQIGSLCGCALRSDREVIGYAYYVCEGRKGLIGDFYIRAAEWSMGRESQLLGGVVQSIVRTSGMRRIESQLMMFRTTAGASPLPLGQNLKRHDRFFMRVDGADVLSLPAEDPSFRVNFVPWAERFQEEMAHLLSAAYRGHVDSEINDQYRNIPGARVFLMNIVKFPGCGQFSPTASVLAVDPSTGRLCGMCLASHISRTSGHVTQLCVLPALRGVKLGYELLRQTLERLVASGCTSVSLTVTCANVDAIRLYHDMGFRSEATFPALVWEGW